MRKHYGSNSVIVFDGYSDNVDSTKKAEQQRRALKYTCADIHFDENMAVTVAQEKLLANTKNKERLIAILSEKMRNEGYTIKQAVDDADSLIIQTTYQVTVVGEDVDLLILLIALAPAERKIYFINPRRGNVEEKMYCSRELQTHTKLQSSILF